ncbi:MAG: hypothetical protein Q4A52_01300, partial [Bacillota bacterium]|nr:hypothetical protein [Bacillota bacterium]
MLRLELKKLLRRRYLWILILGSFFIVSFHVSALRSIDILKFNYQTEVNWFSKNLEPFRELTDRHLSSDKFRSFYQMFTLKSRVFSDYREVLRKIFLTIRKEGSTETEQEKQYTETLYRALTYFEELTGIFDLKRSIALDEATKWEFLAHQHMLQTGRHQVDLRYAMNLGR